MLMKRQKILSGLQSYCGFIGWESGIALLDTIFLIKKKFVDDYEHVFLPEEIT